jgi:hypothetical protein
MMYSTIFLVSLISMLLGAANGNKNSMRKLRFSNGSKMVSMNVQVNKGTPNLRQENVPAISLEASNNYVKMKGFLEDAIYSDMNSDGKCIHPQYKFISALNVCAAASDTTLGAFYMETVYADPTGNTYYFYDQYFSDSACSMSTTELMYEGSALIAICQYTELYFARDYPLNPATDNLGFTLLTYNTASNCMTNNYQMGVLESQYAKVGQCIQISDPNDDPTAGDIEFTSCSPTTGLVTTTYSSTDGTCTGTSTSTTLSSSNACLTPDSSGYYMGYTNYGCSTVVTTD